MASVWRGSKRQEPRRGRRREQCALSRARRDKEMCQMCESRSARKDGTMRRTARLASVGKGLDPGS
ncbi:hypothetical protein FH972_022389 [Carpinus fangiana]|uniref:Uncharacterized protein n=1 Tax=Carpinus fangiana TaxID=176857 RepID=A0A5N6KSN7_9ROSI|nr:hypothetical protein FH972_022389 [Carpinus fangiana]